MKRLYFLMLLLLPIVGVTDDDRTRNPNPTSVIEDSMCIGALDGIGCLHVDEDVANLVINVIGADGVNIAVYDVVGEQEDIAAIGTYAAPSANNVRVSPQANAGSDLTQMMFADAVYAGEDWVTISVSDGQVTIMDFHRWVDLRSNANDLVVLTGTADSGNSTSFVDAALTEADTNYWAKNIAVLFTSGTITGQAFCVVSFIPGSDTVNFTPAATQAVSTNTYSFIAAPACDPFR